MARSAGVLPKLQSFQKFGTEPNMHRQTMVPNHGTKYEENPSSYYKEMYMDECELIDGETDTQMDWGYLYIFPNLLF